MQEGTPAPTKRGIASPERAQNVRRALARVPDLVRVEANIDSQPIWAPSSYADERTRSYPLNWRGEGASVTVQASGEYGMLRAFDKLVLIALVHLWNEQGRQQNGRVYFRIIDLIAALERTEDGKTYELVKQSLHRLRGCLIQYQFSYFDAGSNEWVSLRDKNILSNLLIVEPRKQIGDSYQLTLDGLTYAEFDFMVVENLVGNFTRPVSIRLLQALSERGILFESYVNAVLFRHETVRKDLFELWHDLGLSTKGINYGSQLASRMRKDLDKLVEDEVCPLGEYRFEKSKSRARSQNLVLIRSKGAVITAPSPKYRTSDNPRKRYEAGKSADRDKLVEWMKLELHDESPNDANLKVIAAKLPESVIRAGVNDAYAYYRDGQTRNPTAYFVGMMNNRAEELGIDLGFKREGTPAGAPKPLSLRRDGPAKQENPLAELTKQLSQQFKADGSR